MNAEEIKKQMDETFRNFATGFAKDIETSIQENLIKPLMDRVDEIAKNCEAVKHQNLILVQQVHRILEGEEVKKNRENYSDIVMYGVRENVKKTNEEAAKSALASLGFEEGEENMGDLVLTARRLNTDPRPGEARPLVATLGSDEWRDRVLKAGKKKIRDAKKSGDPNDLPKGLADNVCIDTRIKRRVLYFVADQLRKDKKIVVVPEGTKAKMLVLNKDHVEANTRTTSGSGRSSAGKFIKMSYQEAVDKYRHLLNQEFINRIKKESKVSYDLTSVLLY